MWGESSYGRMRVKWSPGTPSFSEFPRKLKASFTFSSSPGLFFQLGRSSASSWSCHCSWGLQKSCIMSHPEFNLITISGYFVIVWLWKSHRRSDFITLLYFPRFLKLHDMTIVLLAGCSMLTQGTKKVLLKFLTPDPIKRKVPLDNDPRYTKCPIKTSQ